MLTAEVTVYEHKSIVSSENKITLDVQKAFYNKLRTLIMAFIPTLARMLAAASDGAYASESELQNVYGSDLESIFDKALIDIRFIPRTRGFIYHRQNHSVISFKGSDTITDWIPTNLSADPMPIPWLDNNPWGHSGFVAAYSIVRGHIISQNRNYNNTIYVTGHSLGGAIATQAALDLANIFPEKTIILYTFASPKVGFTSFVDLFNNKLGNDSHRVYLEGDIVPTLPPFPYEHVNNEHHLQAPNLGTLEKHKIGNIRNIVNSL
jgi:hypothetical protein